MKKKLFVSEKANGMAVHGVFFVHIRLYTLISIFFNRRIKQAFFFLHLFHDEKKKELQALESELKTIRW